MPNRCPHCHEDIEALNYIEYGYEQGVCDIDGGGGCSDNGFEGDEIIYSCPECGDELDPNDVEFYDEEDEANEEISPPREETPLLTPTENTNMFADTDGKRKYEQIKSTLSACPKCGLEYEFDRGEIEIECKYCGETVVNHLT